jgi:hypothetical protein
MILYFIEARPVTWPRPRKAEEAGGDDYVLSLGKDLSLFYCNCREEGEKRLWDLARNKNKVWNFENDTTRNRHNSFMPKNISDTYI